MQSTVAKRQAASHHLQLALGVVDDFEAHIKLDNHSRWTPNHPSYQAAAMYIKNREFIRAVNELERLVVQRLFELSKANLAGTGKVLVYISLLPPANYT